MPEITWHTGDVFDQLATIPDGSVDLVVTSPPFLALRSYLPADHPDKGKEIGSEATPAAFIDVMLAVTAELRRVLAPHGSIAVELGDTYAGHDNRGSGEDNGHYEAKTRAVQTGPGWPLAKSRTMIPELIRVALAYGINPFTGQPSPAGKWRVRNVVTWCRPNPPVGALGDKWRPATSDIVIACTSPKRYWDDLATRTEASPNTHARSAQPRHDLPSQQRDGNWSTLAQIDSDAAAGAPLLDYWVIPPRGYKGAHYAVYPPELVAPLVKAMCPQRVCVTCGEPSRRIVETTNAIASTAPRYDETQRRANTADTNMWKKQTGDVSSRFDTLGWSDCGHGTWRPGRVLDPFAGSGTTLLVAHGHGRDSIGIDLDPRNLELTRQRLGPFIDIAEPQPTTEGVTS